MVKPKVYRISDVLFSFGNRVYEFTDETIPRSGWIDISLDGFPNERQLFLVVKNNVVSAIVHACPQLPPNARYVWQGRLYQPPKVPAACPRCRYRLDYVPKRREQ